MNTAQKQEKEQEIQEEAIAVNIEVPVRVYDGNKFVENLTIKDFVIYEDGKKQEIDAVYLIKERAIQRKESVEKETTPKQEELKRIVRALRIMIAPKGSEVEAMQDEYCSSLYSSTQRNNISLVVTAYQTVHNRLINIRGIEQTDKWPR